jgi:maltose alpha-D-glucosyltransferase/alpha-amylase
MPGTPIIYYGDEIGMGDNIFLGDRDGVRTPMQWSPDRNGGYSKVDPARLFLPAVMDPVYGYEAVNVEAQERSPSSLLNWMKQIIRVRKAHPAFGRGALRFIYPGNRKVLAYLRETATETILCVANLSRAPQPVMLDLAAYKGRVPIELLHYTPFPPIGELPYFVTLPAYGFYWFMLASEAEAPAWYQPYVTPMPELTTLVMADGWDSLVEGEPGRTLREQILPEFAQTQRWFGAKDQAVQSITLTTRALLPGPEREWFLPLYRMTLASGERQDYFLPLAVALETRTEDPLAALLPYVMARVRRGARTGVLYDAMADPEFVHALIAAMRDNRAVPADGGELRFWATGRLSEVETEGREIQRLGKEQSNTSITIGDVAILKAYRRIGRGSHPEVEIGRFLTDTADYRNTPPLYGAAELVDAEGVPSALLVLQGFVRNQGDGWGYSVAFLDRTLSDLELMPPEQQEQVDLADHVAGYIALARTLGARTAELHRAFAIDSTDPAFAPEPVTAADLAAWRERALTEADVARRALAAFSGELTEETEAQRAAMLANWDDVTDRLRELLPDRLDAVKTRHHGDYHLGQVLVAKDDWYLLDFEGEPLRPVEERRTKASPLRDVAGMLRSFDYAAWSALFDRSSLKPERQDQYVPWALGWRDHSRQGFLDGYHAAIDGCRSYPADPAVARRLIDFFTLEKALYELRYEARNRPAWLRIPLQGVRALLVSGADETEGE